MMILMMILMMMMMTMMTIKMMMPHEPAIITTIICRGQPCTILLLPSGPPAPPSACLVSHLTYSSLTVSDIMMMEIKKIVRNDHILFFSREYSELLRLKNWFPVSVHLCFIQRREIEEETVFMMIVLMSCEPI